ncbi:diacylglycerol kinase family lipid kinase [Devosia sp. BK]|uniref:diacylglycerol/lipid kinase family protein n=1 Tax=Devosia sp. BK TaxID=2871706 RepID=UPI002939E34A|nr:diacylglycerol kinase family protein [Devosia sp. BK]MDV3250025.1 diacylglycerol kinase family lipid kinase [Devosia sp. BK]
MHIAAVFNRDSGTLRTMNLEEFCAEAKDAFAAAGHEFDCNIVNGDEVVSTLENLATSDTVEAIIAAGGDGTISTAAALALKENKILGLLPAGTMNLFARALGVPQDIHRAVHAIAHGSVGSVDIATANEQPFVHQFSVGIHPRLVRIRNGMVYRSRFGKMLASLRAIAAAAANPPKFDVEYTDSTGKHSRTVSGIAVSNNPLDDGPVPVAGQLDSGRLGVYFAAPVTTGELIGLAIDVLLGRWRNNPQVTELECTQLELHFPKRKKDAQAVIDGELIDLDRKVILKAVPQALRVILPKAES